MAYVIALAGKGGTGKTSLAGLTVRYIVEKKKKSVLAVDADSNACLNEALGVSVHATIGSLREESLEKIRSGGERPGGMSMEQLFDYQVSQSVIEAKGFDLMVMGRPEGPGCYCYANNVLSAAIRRLTDSYPCVVIDNEAGLENLSRRLVQRADRLVFVSDPSARGLTTARRLYDLAGEMKVVAGELGLVVNRVHDEACLERARRIFDNTPVSVLGSLPEDAELSTRDAEGAPIWTLPGGNPLLRAAEGILERLVSQTRMTKSE